MWVALNRKCNTRVILSICFYPSLWGRMTPMIHNKHHFKLGRVGSTVNSSQQNKHKLACVYLPKLSNISVLGRNLESVNAKHNLIFCLKVLLFRGAVFMRITQ
jgi:hypothetical protein